MITPREPGPHPHPPAIGVSQNLRSLSRYDFADPLQGDPGLSSGAVPAAATMAPCQ